MFAKNGKICSGHMTTVEKQMTTEAAEAESIGCIRGNKVEKSRLKETRRLRHFRTNGYRRKKNRIKNMEWEVEMHIDLVAKKHADTGRL